MGPNLILVALHVLGNLVFVGATLAVSLLLVHGPGDDRQRGQAARLVHRRLAAPAFGVSFLMGVVLLGMNPVLYFKATHYMHAKLPLALGAVALHFLLGVRARKAENGETQGPGPAAALGAGFAVCAALAAFLVLLKPF